jgi:hypothetical protein
LRFFLLYFFVELIAFRFIIGGLLIILGSCFIAGGIFTLSGANIACGGFFVVILQTFEHGRLFFAFFIC